MPLYALECNSEIFKFACYKKLSRLIIVFIPSGCCSTATTACQFGLNQQQIESNSCWWCCCLSSQFPSAFTQDRQQSHHAFKASSSSPPPPSSSSLSSKWCRWRWYRCQQQQQQLNNQFKRRANSNFTPKATEHCTRITHSHKYHKHLECFQ